MFGNESKNVDARVVNNALVVSFLTSDPPRVWRADMSGLASSTLELRETTPGKFHLVMKTSAGKEEDISTFTDKMAAADALKSVTHAMLRGETAGPGAAAAAHASSGGGFFKGLFVVVAWLLGILAVLALLLKVFSAANPGAVARWGGGAHMPSGVKEGTPMSADKLFDK